MPIPPALPPKDQPPSARPSLRHGLERAAGEINPFLVILAIGIALLDLTCYVGKIGTRQLMLHSEAFAASPAAMPADDQPTAYRH